MDRPVADIAIDEDLVARLIERNPVRGVPLSSRTDAVRERLASGVIPHAERLRALWDRLVAVPGWAGPPLWLHGDPHPGNLLVEHGLLAAVIDFGDLTAGDPATDLAAAWLVFDAEDRRAFRAHLESGPGPHAAPHAPSRARRPTTPTPGTGPGAGR